MITASQPGSVRDQFLRLFSTALVLVGQSLIWPGCNTSGTSGAGGATGNANSAPPTPQPVNTNGPAADAEDDGAAADDATSNGTAAGSGPFAGISGSPDGYWLTTRTVDGRPRTGLASGGQISDTVAIDIVEEDGTRRAFSGQWEGESIRGFCNEPLEIGDDYVVDPEDPLGLGLFGTESTACEAAFTADGQELVIVEGETQWTLRRSQVPSPTMIGAWDVTGAASERAVTGFDGHILALLLLGGDANQDWTALWDDTAGAFVGTDPQGYIWVGMLPDEDGATVLAWLRSSGSFAGHQTYSRRDEPGGTAAPVTGRWMSVYNTGAYTNSVRGQASVIRDGDELYVYQRDDTHRILYQPDYDTGGYWSIFADGPDDDLHSGSSSLTTWSGRIEDGVTLISGYANDDRAQTFSLAKALSFSAGQLSGEWNSLSVDYDTPSEPGQIIGQAQLSFDGDVLTITDHEDDATYQVEARWTDDHFAGEWWNAETPSSRGQWTGELVLEGTMIHGKWELGEWSFTQGPIAASQEDFDAVPSGQVYVIASPESPIAAVGRDPDTNDLIQYLLDGGRVGSVKVVSSAGRSALITLDDRLLASSIELESGERLTLEWAADLTSVTVQQTTAEGVTDTSTLAIDLSDAGLEAALQSWETSTGRSARLYRDYLAEHGNPWISGESSSASRVQLWDQVQNSPADRVFKALGGGGMIVTGIQLIKLGLVLAGKSVAGGTLLAAGAVGLMVFASVMILAAVFIVFVCVPCSLACFMDCDLPEPAQRVCCLAAGACTVTTQAECASANGTYYPNMTTCDNSPCGEPDVTIEVAAPCCLSGGTCMTATPSACAGFSGTSMGNSTSCENVVCPTD